MKIGLVTGCFDVLHIGHIHFLKIAKKHCDKLVVGINSDLVVRSVKGISRPVNSENYRKEILLSIKYVDEVFIFNTWFIESVIAKYKPDIYFISEIDPGEKVKTLVAHKYNVTLFKIPMHESYGKISSTSIICKFLED